MKKLFSIAILLIVFGCTDKKNNELVSPDTDLFSASQFAVIDFTDVMNSIGEASLESDLSFDNTMENYSFLSKGKDLLQMNSSMMGDSTRRMGNTWINKFNFNKHLGKILRQLRLTDQQKSDVTGFLETFHDGMKPLVKDFTAAIKTILKDANLQRKDIMKDLRQGAITREEAQQLLNTLNQETKDKIINDTTVKGIKEQMCALRAELLAGIESVLTAEQLEKWNTWLSRIPNPC